MGESLTATYLVANLILPPTSLALLALCGLWLARRHRRLGIAVAGGSAVLLLLLSTPAIGYALLRMVEPDKILDLREAASAQAIVVLAGGKTRSAPEWGGSTVSAETLQRTRYGAALARQLRLPVLVSGGSPSGGPAEATLMGETLATEFGVAPRWIEAHSDDTLGNARNSADLLKADRIERIVLVTSAARMPRAQRAFEQVGLTVIPAPTVFFSHAPFRWAQWVPGIDGLRLSDRALREWLAQMLYRLR